MSPTITERNKVLGDQTAIGYIQYLAHIGIFEVFSDSCTALPPFEVVIAHVDIGQAFRARV